MSEDHRAQQPEPSCEPDRRLERERLQDPDREEDERERVRRGAVLARKQVGDEGLRYEAAAEAVESEQSRQAQDDPAGALQLRPPLRCELAALLNGGGESE